MSKFYFTFGSDDELQLHVGGWIVIEADDYYDARVKFTEKYGVTEGGYLPFAFQYSEEEFKQTNMYRRGQNLGHGEWEK